MKFRPMLADRVTRAQLEQLRFPVIVQPKLDGVRALVLPKGRLVSRKLIAIPNLQCQRRFGGRFALHYHDGELIAGDPTAPDAYNRTQDVVMEKHADAKDVKFYVFDHFETPLMGYAGRVRQLARQTEGVVLVPSYRAHNATALLELEEQYAKAGFEGVMLRDPDGAYKFGRATLKQGQLIKLKRFEDSEGKVLAVYEQEHNTNKAEKNELGLTKRSSAKSGKVGTGMVGGFQLQDLKTGVVFDCAPGFLTLAQRTALWPKRDTLLGKVAKYRFQPAGVKEKPRFPRWIGWRSKIDM